MTQNILYPDRALSKAEKYDSLCPQIETLLSKPMPPLVAGLGNVVAMR